MLGCRRGERGARCVTRIGFVLYKLCRRGGGGNVRVFLVDKYEEEDSGRQTRGQGENVPHTAM